MGQCKDCCSERPFYCFLRSHALIYSEIQGLIALWTELIWGSLLVLKVLQIEGFMSSGDWSYTWSGQSGTLLGPRENACWRHWALQQEEPDPSARSAEMCELMVSNQLQVAWKNNGSVQMAFFHWSCSSLGCFWVLQSFSSSSPCIFWE